MTELAPDTSRSWQPSFPGVVPQADQREQHASALVDAAYATLRALDDEHLLTPAHAVTCQLVLELARAVTAGVRSGRASAVALAARELREAIATLPTAVAVVPDDWARFVDLLRNESSS